MSKTYLNQVEKTKMLVNGLSDNQTLVRNVGISDEQVAELSQIAAEAEVLNKAVDDLRAALSVKTREANPGGHSDDHRYGKDAGRQTGDQTLL